ncbi:MAG TPA: glycosyltransferase, partial [Acidimicrobiales bacterium]|nr:glycosyltransferase [Acidimicrobiales bacterium]
MSFAEWAARYDTLDDADRAAIAGLVDGLDHPPTISIVLPVFDTEERFLRAAIESVRGQLYPHWELCVADDCSTDPRVGQVLAEHAAQDDRIRVARRAENGHISAASNTALELATGRWVAFLDHDDLLAPHALAMVALELAGRPDAGVV